jgi:4,5-DOPA dioxygenase extradiol
MNSSSSKLMPVGFVGHGSPMTALETEGPPAAWHRWAQTLPKPKAILMISAHWVEKPIHIGPNQKSPLIYDFYGFPEELYQVHYEPSASPELSKEVFALLSQAGLKPIESRQRGLDHGAWAPLLHMYPQGDVPILQVSIGTRVPMSEHLALGRALAPLREQDVFILASGNVTHNLRKVNFGHRDAPPIDWARDFDEWVVENLTHFNLEALCNYIEAPGGHLSVPTDDHYTPLLVAAAAASVAGTPQITFPYEGFEYESLSMRCVEFNNR